MPQTLVESEASQTTLTNLRNLFYQWEHLGHMHHDGTVWQRLGELGRVMNWTYTHGKLLWQDLGAIQPNWCCSRCPKRGIAEPDRYVTQAGALRLLMMDGSSSKGLELFWAELLPTVFQEPMLEEEPDPSLQVYGVCVQTVNKGRLDSQELYEFKEYVRELGWTEHLRGRRKESDYFKTKGYAALAIPLIKERKWQVAVPCN